MERSYRARAYGQISQAQLEELIHGIEIDGIRYGAIDANLERRTGANVWIEMTLREGKNREVRRVLEFLGLRVSRLIRTRYGPFVLGDLPVGDIGEVRAADLAAFRQTLKIAAKQRAAVPDVSVRGDRPAPPRRAAPPVAGARPSPRANRTPGERPTAPRPLRPAPPKPKPVAPAEEVAPPPARPARIVRQPGWAKPKPKAGARPRSGGPRGRK